MPAAEAYVTPTVVRWARLQAGYELADVARWFGGQRKKVEAWETGVTHPTFTQLRTLSKRFDRPLADFFRESPPRELPLPADFRAEQSSDPRQIAFLRRAVRNLEELQDAAAELASSGGEAATIWRLRVDRTEPIGEIANRIRADLMVSHDEQANWRDSAQAWSGWRQAVERAGALVFVLSGYDSNAFGGIAIPGEPYPVIGINGKDPTDRKVFTLLHEVVHLALRQSAITDAADGAADDDHDGIEVFCNAVAAEVLMPEVAVRAHAVVRLHPIGVSWSGVDLRELAVAFRVSQQALYRRLVTLGVAPMADYRRWVTDRPLRSLSVPGGEGGGNFYNTFLHHTSNAYLHLVFRAYHARKINITNVCDLLGHGVVVVKKIERRFIEGELGGSP